MPSGFIPLREFAAPKPIANEAPSVKVPAEAAIRHATDPSLQMFVRDVRLARAALADALDVALADLLRDIAADVLGRELLLAPVDLGVIVARALERAKLDAPVSVHVHPNERAMLGAIDVPVVDDAALRRGDVTIHVKCGTIDVSLGARLAAVLDRET